MEGNRITSLEELAEKAIKNPDAPRWQERLAFAWKCRRLADAIKSSGADMSDPNFSHFPHLEQELKTLIGG